MQTEPTAIEPTIPRPRKPRARRAARPSEAPVSLILCTKNAAGEETRAGFAFPVSEDGQVMTARHLLHGTAEVTLQTREGARIGVRGILAEDADCDLALLQMEGQATLAFTFRSSEKIGESESVVIGAEAVVEGAISAVREGFLGKDRWLQIRADAPFRMTGAPVLDGKGCVVGVLTAMIREQDHLHFAIPSEAAQALIGRLEKPVRARSLASFGKQAGPDLFLDADFLAALTADLSGDMAAALKSAKIVEQRFAEHATAQILLADIFFDLKFYDDALKAALRAVELRAHSGDLWFALGVLQGKLHKMEEQIESLRQAIRWKPNFPEAWILLGATYMELHRYAEAEAAFQEVVQLSDGSADGWHRLGAALASQEKWETAVGAYQKSLLCDSAQVGAWLNLGAVLMKLSRWEAAADGLQRAAMLESGLAAAWLALGEAHTKRKALGEAAAAYQKYLQLKPLDDKVWLLLAGVLCERKEWREEIGAYQKIIEMNCGNVALWCRLALAHRKLNQWEDARGAAYHATRLQPAHAPAWFDLGLACARLNRMEETQDALTRLRTLDAMLARELECVLRGDAS